MTATESGVPPAPGRAFRSMPSISRANEPPCVKELEEASGALDIVQSFMLLARDKKVVKESPSFGKKAGQTIPASTTRPDDKKSPEELVIDESGNPGHSALEDRRPVLVTIPSQRAHDYPMRRRSIVCRQPPAEPTYHVPSPASKSENLEDHSLPPGSSSPRQHRKGSLPLRPSPRSNLAYGVAQTSPTGGPATFATSEPLLVVMPPKPKGTIFSVKRKSEANTTPPTSSELSTVKSLQMTRSSHGAEFSSATTTSSQLHCNNSLCDHIRLSSIGEPGEDMSDSPVQVSLLSMRASASEGGAALQPKVLNTMASCNGRNHVMQGNSIRGSHESFARRRSGVAVYLKAFEDDEETAERSSAPVMRGTAFQNARESIVREKPVSPGREIRDSCMIAGSKSFSKSYMRAFEDGEEPVERSTAPVMRGTAFQGAMEAMAREKAACPEQESLGPRMLSAKPKGHMRSFLDDDEVRMERSSAPVERGYAYSMAKPALAKETQRKEKESLLEQRNSLLRQTSAPAQNEAPQETLQEERNSGGGMKGAAYMCAREAIAREREALRAREEREAPLPPPPPPHNQTNHLLSKLGGALRGLKPSNNDYHGKQLESRQSTLEDELRDLVMK
eukprot:gene22645-29793_t